MKHLLCTVLAVAVALAAGCASEQPAEPGTAVLQVAPSSDAPEAVKTAAETLCANLASDAVLSDALERLADSPGGAEPYAGPDAVARLRADLRIERLPQADLVSVQLTAGPLPRRVQIVRAVVEAVLRFEETARTKRLADLQEQQHALAQAIEGAEPDLRDLRKNLGLATTDAANDPRQMLLDALEELAEEKQPGFDAARDAWQRFKDLRAQAAEAQNTGILLEIYPDLAEEVEADPKVIAARVLAEAIETQAERITKTHGEASDVVIALRAQLEKARADLAERRSEAFKERLEQKAALLAREADLAERDRAELARQIAQAHTEVGSIADDLETFRARERDLDDLRARLADAEKEAGLLNLQIASGAAAVRIVRWP